MLRNNKRSLSEILSRQISRFQQVLTFSARAWEAILATRTTLREPSGKVAAWHVFPWPAAIEAAIDAGGHLHVPKWAICRQGLIMWDKSVCRSSHDQASTAKPSVDKCSCTFSLQLLL